MKKKQKSRTERMHRRWEFIHSRVNSGLLGSSVVLLVLFTFVFIAGQFDGGVTGYATLEAEDAVQGYELILYVLGTLIVILLAVYVVILYRKGEE